MLYFMFVGENDFKKPILDELGQNWTFIAYWKRNQDKKLKL